MGKHQMHRVGCTLFALAILTSFVNAEEANDGAELEVANEERTVKRLIDETRDSVVTVTVEGRDGRRAGMGTGFVISDDGLIATNLHVIGEARPIRVRFHDGRQLTVKEVHASDRNLDLAIVRVPAKNLKPLKLADDEVAQGTSVIALGNPMGLRHSVVDGIVSGHRDIEGRKMIQIAMPIEPGNSGGPLLDLNRNVVGVITMKSAVTANLGFAVRIADLQSLIQAPNPVPIERWKTIGSLDPRKWTTLFGASWQKRAGRIVVSEAGEGFGGRSLCLSSTPLPKQAFEIGVYVRLDDEGGAAGLAFASDGDQKHFGFYPSAGRLRLTRFDGPTVYSWKVLDEVPSEYYRSGEWNHLKVRVDDEKLLCYINDHLLFDRQLPGLKTGSAGLVKFRQTSASFKRFEIVEGKLEPTRISDNRREKIASKLDAMKLDSWTPSESVDLLAEDADATFELIRERAAEYDRQARQLRQLGNDVHVREVCRDLARVVERRPIDLIHAALLISRLDNRDLEVDVYREQFEQLVQDVRSEIPDEANAVDRLRLLDEFLFRQNGFHGSRTNYYHAANSYFDRVLDDREGLPISLSVLYMELGRRLDLVMEGVGLPGHFVVRHLPKDGDPELIDVFDSGSRLSDAEARRMTTRLSGQVFRAEFLDAYSSEAILVRMLRNLQGIAQRDQDLEASLRYLEAMVIVEPEEPSHRGIRAVMRHQTGRKQAAIDDLDWFLQNEPAGIDLHQIRQMKDAFRTQ